MGCTFGQPTDPDNVSKESLVEGKSSDASVLPDDQKSQEERKSVSPPEKPVKKSKISRKETVEEEKIDEEQDEECDSKPEKRKSKLADQQMILKESQNTDTSKFSGQQSPYRVESDEKRYETLPLLKGTSAISLNNSKGALTSKENVEPKVTLEDLKISFAPVSQETRREVIIKKRSKESKEEPLTSKIDYKASSEAGKKFRLLTKKKTTKAQESFPKSVLSPKSKAPLFSQNLSSRITRKTLIKPVQTTPKKTDRKKKKSKTKSKRRALSKKKSSLGKKKSKLDENKAKSNAKIKSKISSKEKVKMKRNSKETLMTKNKMMEKGKKSTASIHFKSESASTRMKKNIHGSLMVKKEKDKKSKFAIKTKVKFLTCIRHSLKIKKMSMRKVKKSRTSK